MEIKLGFTKLDEGILQSSIMAEDGDTFKVWVALLATCKQDGIAHCSSVFIASICRLPQKKADEILKKFENPDPRSRSKEQEGRRIKRVDGGYELINYFDYRDSSLKDAEAERKRIYRQKIKGKGEDGPDNLGHVPNSPDSSASASASLFSSLKEGDRGEERSEIKVVEFMDRKAELGQIFKRRNQPIAGRIVDYIAELTFEFNDVNWREEIEKKIASLQDHPFKKGANIALQFRNWMANARRFTKEREARDRTGSPAGFKAQADVKKRAEAEVREKFKDEIAVRRLPNGMLPTDLLLKISREEQAILKRIRSQGK